MQSESCTGEPVGACKLLKLLEAKPGTALAIRVGMNTIKLSALQALDNAIDHKLGI